MEKSSLKSIPFNVITRTTREGRAGIVIPVLGESSVKEGDNYSDEVLRNLFNKEDIKTAVLKMHIYIDDVDIYNECYTEDTKTPLTQIFLNNGSVISCCIPFDEFDSIFWAAQNLIEEVPCETKQ
jgi:hypothetical protein